MQDEFIKDAQKFNDTFRNTYQKFQTNFRFVMNNVRDEHYDEFKKLGNARIGTPS